MVGARAYVGSSEQVTAFFSSDPNSQQLNDPWANTGIQLDIAIYKGETYYIYPYQTASTLNGINIQLFFDEITAKTP